jgi:hypothetical protein
LICGNCGGPEKPSAKAQTAKKVHDADVKQNGFSSAGTSASAALFQVADNELLPAKLGTCLRVELDWFPTLWRSCISFGPSMDNPNGHGGFLSPRMVPALAESDTGHPTTPSPVGRKRARAEARSKTIEASVSSSRASSEMQRKASDEATNRLIVAVDLGRAL